MLRETNSVIARQRTQCCRSNLRTQIASSLPTEGTVKGFLISPDANFGSGVRASSALTSLLAMTILFLTVSPALQAAKETVTKPVTKATPSLGRAEAKKTRLIQVGDRIKIKIYPEDEFIKSTETEVSSEGTITLPLIGKVQVLGMRILEVEQKIVGILAQDYLVNPVVVIEVVTSMEEREKITVAILGQVQKPGTYEISPETKLTLLGLISTAGGFTDIANVKKIKIIRKEAGKTRVIRANAESIIGGRQPDIELEPGDVIHVGESFF